jgi:hypothetical protein
MGIMDSLKKQKHYLATASHIRLAYLGFHYDKTKHVVLPKVLHLAYCVFRQNR